MLWVMEDVSKGHVVNSIPIPNYKSKKPYENGWINRQAAVKGKEMRIKMKRSEMKKHNSVLLPAHKENNIRF